MDNDVKKTNNKEKTNDGVLGDCCHHEETEDNRCENGFYFITQGSCIVRNHDDGYVAKRLK